MTAKKKGIAYGFSAALVAMAILAFTPTASAQNEAITVSVSAGDTANQLLKPEVGLLSVPITVTLNIPAVSGCTANIQVNYKATGPAYSTPVMNPATYSFVYQSDQQAPFVSGGGEQKILPKVNLLVSTTRQAPAFENGEYSVSATVVVQGTSCTMTGGSGNQPVIVKNDYFPLLEALPQQTVLKSGQNSQVRFPIDVTNFGNGQTRVSAESKYNSKNELDALIPPPTFVVESKSQQGTAAKDAKTVFVTARTPHSNGYTNSIYSFQVDFTGEYAGTKPAGEPAVDKQSVFLSLQVQGVYAPGFDPVMLIGALGVGMLGIRRFVKLE